jgi:arylsulfatase A-like enzyme
MHAMNEVCDYLAPLPLLPGISILAIVAGMVLIFARKLYPLIARWAGPLVFRATAGESSGELRVDSPPDGFPPIKSRERKAGVFFTTLSLGLLAGWLELGLVLVSRTVNPHISIDALRTNRHFVWMIPVADVFIFGFVGVGTALLARFRPGLARWIASRLAVGLIFLTLLLTVEGLYATAALSLSCGLAAVLGPILERWANVGFGRVTRLGVLTAAIGLIILTVVSYRRVTSAEERALSLCPPAKPGAPNVLLVVLDNVRAASLSLYGHNRPTTPNLERLARNGILFSEARSTAPWTLPSHASMMTGRWPHELSVGWDLPLDGTFPTLAEVLAREGYATAAFVANVYYCNARYGMDRGFARYEDSYENQTVSLFEIVWSSGLGRRIIQGLGYPIRIDDGDTSVRKSAAMINRDVLGWLGGRPAGRPFFVFLNYYDAHRPHILEGDRSERFGIAALPCSEQSEIDKKFLNLAGKSVPADLEHQRIINEGFQSYHDHYDTAIAYLDRQVGLLIDELERRGLLENTLVILTSDHGEQLGEHGVIAHGASLYRPEVHVPLLMIPPGGSSAARLVSEPVSLHDIAATVAECTGLGTRDRFPGSSLTRFRDDDDRRAPETLPILSEVERNEVLPRSAQIPSSLGPVISLVSGDRIYIRGTGGREELYDRVHDPLESVDLAKYPQSRPEIDRFREELTRVWPNAPELAR